ncbi:MAG: DUF4097 family beta strand repeat-containing protein, partial [Anaerovorax sp.]
VKNIAIVAGILVGIGIILTLVGGLNGGFWDSGQAVNKHVSVEKFKNIKVDVDVFSVKVVQGDGYQVDYSYTDKKEKPRIHVEGDTLIVDSQKGQHFFNFDLIGGLNLLKNHHRQEVVITYPRHVKLGNVTLAQDLGDCNIEGGSFDLLDVTLDMGDLALSSVFMDKFHLNMSKGDCTISSVKANKGKINMDMGNFTATAFMAKGLDILLSAGDLDLQGTFQGTNNLETDMGEINVDTDLPKSRYSYHFAVDMGDVTIDGNSAKSQSVVNINAPNQLNLTSGVGDSNVNFGKESVD